MEDEAIDAFKTIFGIIQLAVTTGVLIAWFLTPLYAISTPACTVSLTPWGIILKTPNGHSIMGAGTSRLILGLLLITLVLSVIGIFTRGTVSLIIYFTSFIILAYMDFNILLPTIYGMSSILNAQLHELAVKDPSLLTRIGEITVINGQEAVLLPIHTADNLVTVLLWLVAIAIVNCFIATLSKRGLEREVSLEPPHE